MADQVNMSAPGGGGGFVFDADKLDGVIKKWEDLLRGVRQDAADINVLGNMQKPGLEFASDDWHQLAEPSGKALAEANKRMQDYIQTYIDQLNAAKKQITTREADHADEITKMGNTAQ